jgi:hypothetical protein
MARHTVGYAVGLGDDGAADVGEANPAAAIEDSIGKPVNWVLLVGFLCSLSFWIAVVVGVVATV